jgi:hypothetical protein
MSKRPIRPRRRWDNTKLGKAAFLSTNDTIRSYVPDTRKATKYTISSMLDEYGTVYVKPTIGTGGRGIFRVWKVPAPVSGVPSDSAAEGSLAANETDQSAGPRMAGDSQLASAPASYRFQSGKTTLRFDAFEPMYAALKGRMGPKYHVVQKAIDLLDYDSRPFDVRVMVQKHGVGMWDVTGIIGRVAHPAKIVTNYHNGGTPLPVERLLAPHIPSADVLAAYIDSLNQLGRRIAAHMQTGFQWVNAIGIDFAVDQELRPWVLEVNTLPDITIFRKLPDKSVFRRMVRIRSLQRRK